MASRLTIIRGRLRLCRTKLGSVFLFLLGVACVLCVLNWIGNSYMRHESVLDYESTGRHLVGLPGGEHLMAAYHSHRRHKHPKAVKEEERVCKVPKLSLQTDTNRHAYYSMERLTCTGQHLFYLQDSILRLNRTVLGGKKLTHCIYRAIDRISDSYHVYSNPLKRKNNFEIRVKNDFFCVECYTNESKRHEEFMMYESLQDNQRRRLLQLNDRDSVQYRLQHSINQNEVFKAEHRASMISDQVHHSPKLYGSMGLPDLPDSMLHHQEKRVKDSDVNRKEFKLRSAMLKEHRLQDEPSQRAAVPERKRNILGLQPARVEQVQQLMQQQVQQQQQPLQQEWQQQLQQKPHLQQEVKQQANNELQQNRISAQQQRFVSQRNISHGKQEQNIKEVNGLAQQTKIIAKPVEVDLNQNKPETVVEFQPRKDYYDGFANDNEWDALEPDFDQLFAQIHQKNDVMERVARIKPFANSTQMNILMFALDSMSHMSYQRMLPKTYAYLKHTLQAITLDAYNIVGDATTAAIIPIFTGQTEIELPETRVNKEGSHYVDIYPFIWNKFEQSGYVTLYAEDQPSLGTFQLRLNGFEEPPVDHYMRPFWQAALSSEIHEASLQYCLGGKPEHQYTLDYMKDLFVKYPTVPKFAFGFIGELSHADNNPAQYIDNDLKEFLEYLRVNGHLDNTLLIVMGDHGARYSAVRQTTQGKLEERLPMMSFTFPEKFKMKYPHLITNLMRNKEQLSTPFDIHETLKTVLDIYNAEKPIRYSDRGISLLNSIPSNRTCASAGIALHWCTCMQYEYLDVEEKKVKDIAEHVVSQLNDKLHPVRDLCAELSLKKILEAQMVFPNEQVLKYLRSKDSDNRVANFSQTIKLDILHYQLTIETSPNNGLYEATIQAVVIEHSLSIVGDISRINRYGDQPHCILEKHPDLRKYCLCMKEPTPTPRRGYRKMKTSKKN